MKKACLTLAVVGAVTLPTFAKIDLGTPFSDGIVLQRLRDVPVWGKAEPGRKVTVSFAGNEVSTVACAKGCWKVALPAMPASKESRVMTVTESEIGWLWDSVCETVEVKDVLVGEVWMCSGQSNTDCPIWGGAPRYRDGWGGMTLTSTDKPFVRLVKTPLVASVTPKKDFKAKWMKMTPDMFTALQKGTRMPSAMGYYYALELANALDIPVGLVDCSWGGTNIDAWTPRCGYEGCEALKDVAVLPLLDSKAFDEAKKNGVYKGKGIYGGWIQQPTALWNGMVAAYVPMACRGFIWYQGCHNAGEYPRYCDKMHALYNGWSKAFQNPEMKLYFVQLAPWGYQGIANIQMAQAKFDVEEKNAGMAVINDVGNLSDIHPNDKRTVAKRLALHALKRDYGFASVRDNSPTLSTWKIDGSKFVLSFNDAEGWYVYNADRSVQTGFEICGADGKWVAAKIENLASHKDHKGNLQYDGPIKGKDLIVSAEGVAEPKKLRYLHSRPWFGCLYNEVCLPLGAFAIE